ncbi:NifB/NifX family molybdenum-iron cluster-binding protein, partial [Myxococcota bacterium]
RTKWFVVYDSESEKWEWLGNTQALNLPQGAGIQAAQQVIDQNVDVVLTGHCGPKAFRTLTTAGVKVVVGITGTVEQAVKQFQTGALQPASAPDVEGHW